MPDNAVPAPEGPGVQIGTAGWSIASRYAAHFPAEGSHLARYGAALDAVEINSSFYRPHRRTTYERWAASVPADFRFAVKLPRALTHAAGLTDTGARLDKFIGEVSGLGAKLGILLVQLPPKLAFDPAVAARFLAVLRERTSAGLVCEPRHASWFQPAADDLLSALGVARVAADPPPVPAAAEPGGWPDLAYWRLHGSPAMYRTSYRDGRIAAIAAHLARSGARSRWCIFDNTASFEALGDAFALREADAA